MSVYVLFPLFFRERPVAALRRGVGKRKLQFPARKRFRVLQKAASVVRCVQPWKYSFETPALPSEHWYRSTSQARFIVLRLHMRRFICVGQGIVYIFEFRLLISKRPCSFARCTLCIHIDCQGSGDRYYVQPLSGSSRPAIPYINI